ncbi:hypothetical protein HUE56_25830 (plasmid) [Azospirillum oryzae]|uniref:Uncharacterized protein n=1 Tax=Azospirillum oryzae TaxID=286727 RepID=A0A6N1AQ27_9PROT|nr:hypothetical protein [Azospirillum oryzae]KAA0587810.1 hypothetical protein FZ938_16590 [Azospirillum oryzae]QKS53925.1 hypothetical protein HUE56_25830 [Azospirillum oryzae]
MAEIQHVEPRILTWADIEKSEYAQILHRSIQPSTGVILLICLIIRRILTAEKQIKQSHKLEIAKNREQHTLIWQGSHSTDSSLGLSAPVP